MGVLVEEVEGVDCGGVAAEDVGRHGGGVRPLGWRFRHGGGGGGGGGGRRGSDFHLCAV